MRVSTCSRFSSTTRVSSSSSVSVSVRASSSCTKKPSVPGHGSGSVFEPATPKPSAPVTPPPASPQVLQQAVARIDGLLNPVTSVAKSNGAVVTANAGNVEQSANTNPKHERYKKALEQVKAHEALEAQQVAQLPPDERARYAQVKQAVLTDANNPVAALALQKLLFGGRLEKGKDLLGEGTVLEHLTRGALDSRVDAATLLTDLVQELATPSAINQGGRGTCAPTALAIGLNLQNPAEYARILKALAGPSGEVKLASGQTLTREADTAFTRDGSGRALTQRLLAPVFMDVANGKADYQDSAPVGQRRAGATAGGLDVLYDTVYGKNMSFWYGYSGQWKEATMKRITQELAEGQTALAGIRYGTSGGHQLLVTGLESVQGTEYVKYINPWGQEERMERAEFTSRIHGLNFDPGVPESLTNERRALIAA